MYSLGNHQPGVAKSLVLLLGRWSLALSILVEEVVPSSRARAIKEFLFLIDTDNWNV